MFPFFFVDEEFHVIRNAHKIVQFQMAADVVNRDPIKRVIATTAAGSLVIHEFCVYLKKENNYILSQLSYQMYVVVSYT